MGIPLGPIQETIGLGNPVDRQNNWTSDPTTSNLVLDHMLIRDGEPSEIKYC